MRSMSRPSVSASRTRIARRTRTPWPRPNRPARFAPTVVRERHRVRPPGRPRPPWSAEGVDHDADARTVVDLDPDRHPEAGVPAHVARRAIERVEHPPHPGRAGTVRSFLAEDGVVRPCVDDPLDDCMLGRPVDLGDEIARGGLPVDRETPAEPVPLNVRRSVRESHRERSISSSSSADPAGFRAR